MNRISRLNCRPKLCTKTSKNYDARGHARSRQARRAQAYRKAWQARTMAEHTAEALLALLRERGLEDEALEAIAAVTAHVDGTGANSYRTGGEEE